MHGETDGAGEHRIAGQGLSPHARGNPSVCATPRAALGTIPACTGKPCSAATGTFGGGDYPRMHGETRLAQAVNEIDQGLSPHARGNPAKIAASGMGSRTIPACTGKPDRIRP